ncbi:hypothetical protein RIF29_00555 [Crotalaria pallida]|uniref:DUF506 family protein n=1 Tax=Crotalaria pallida TaxID=3830 RepID=A0AAN9IXL7_CROPI
MAGFVRKKRVTDLFDDEAKARLVDAGVDHRRLMSYPSSGSEHSGASDGDSSPCLSELVHDFLEDIEDESESSVGNDLDSERVETVSDYIDSVEDLLCLKSHSNVDPYRNLLHAHVSEAVEKYMFLRERNFSVFRRNVMSFLLEKGHNAAICKTRWNSSSSGGGVTAGNHEFIDVVQSGTSTWQKRYFVELDFASQFEIARATREYSEVLGYVPGIFVGKGDELKRTVRVMCGVAKKCLRCRGLSVPPWRKRQYMQNKWFAPYRRTANPVQGNSVLAVVPAVSGSKCRFVGFDDVVSDSRHGGVFVRTR